ncbi:hypothetical protein E4T39_00889 [Aureobasidium subglaciale]|nr:hypothetical protein E4T39_00889 [Aureobasidium subglaciale]
MHIRPITRSPLLLLTLSICLALPLLAISSHALSSYRIEHALNPWWLPIWHEHFDNRGIIAVIVTSSIVFALDIISVGLIVAGNKASDKSKTIKCIHVVIMLVATIATLIAIIMPAVTNAASPSKSDTIQTWTCRWKDVDGAPKNFEPLCHESTLDEDLVIITKSVDVASTGSHGSPRSNDNPTMAGKEYRV